MEWKILFSKKSAFTLQIQNGMKNPVFKEISTYIVHRDQIKQNHSHWIIICITYYTIIHFKEKNAEKPDSQAPKKFPFLRKTKHTTWSLFTLRINLDLFVGFNTHIQVIFLTNKLPTYISFHLITHTSW